MRSKSFFKRTILVSLILFFVSEIKSAESFAQWKILSHEPQLISGLNFGIMNTTSNQFLASNGPQSVLSLLPFGSIPFNIECRRSFLNIGKISYGDKIAIKVQNFGYLKYDFNGLEAPLACSGSPYYQWEIRSYTSNSSDVQANDEILIYNREADDYLIYCGLRNSIRWSKSCTPNITPQQELYRLTIMNIELTNSYAYGNGTAFVDFLVNGQGVGDLRFSKQSRFKNLNRKFIFKHNDKVKFALLLDHLQAGLRRDSYNKKLIGMKTVSIIGNTVGSVFINPYLIRFVISKE